MIKTKLCDLLQIEYPILQGGMAWVADASLASSVSNAGGLGIVAAMNSNYDQLVKEIRKTKQMTNKPFGVNIMLLSPFVEEVARACIDEKVSIVTTGAGNPSRFMNDWLDAGIKVIPVVPSVAVAKKVAQSGATAVIAEGGESGGHVGELTTLVLLPQIVDAVNLPVIAAGGIADGRQAAACFLLGAVGIQVGTRFLVAKECNIHQSYKQKIIDSKDIDTITTGKRLGHPVRCLKSTFSREFFKKEYDTTISNEELEKFGVGALYLAAKEGNLEKGCFMAGQVAAMVKEEQTSMEIILDIFTKAESVLRDAKKWII